MKKNGKLIVLEGPDGVGKSTLAKDLTNYLNKNEAPTRMLAFPGKEPASLGKHIYQLHHDPQAFGIDSIDEISLQLLHIAAHIDMIKNVIQPELESGINIVLDRYWWSTWVYGRVNKIKDKPLQAMINVELFYLRHYEPDIIFLIDTPMPLRKDAYSSNWKKLQAVYQELLKQERPKYPVKLFLNNGSIADAINFLVSQIGAHTDLNLYDESKHYARSKSTIGSFPH